MFSPSLSSTFDGVAETVRSTVMNAVDFNGNRVEINVKTVYGPDFLFINYNGTNSECTTTDYSTWTATFQYTNLNDLRRNLDQMYIFSKSDERTYNVEYIRIKIYGDLYIPYRLSSDEDNSSKYVYGESDGLFTPEQRTEWLSTKPEKKHSRPDEELYSPSDGIIHSYIYKPTWDNSGILLELSCKDLEKRWPDNDRHIWDYMISKADRGQWDQIKPGCDPVKQPHDRLYVKDGVIENLLPMNEDITTPIKSDPSNPQVKDGKFKIYIKTSKKIIGYGDAFKYYSTGDGSSNNTAPGDGSIAVFEKTATTLKDITKMLSTTKLSLGDVLGSETGIVIEIELADGVYWPPVKETSMMKHDKGTLGKKMFFIFDPLFLRINSEGKVSVRNDRSEEQFSLYNIAEQLAFNFMRWEYGSTPWAGDSVMLKIPVKTTGYDYSLLGDETCNSGYRLSTELPQETSYLMRGDEGTFGSADIYGDWNITTDSCLRVNSHNTQINDDLKGEPCKNAFAWTHENDNNITCYYNVDNGNLFDILTDDEKNNIYDDDGNTIGQKIINEWCPSNAQRCVNLGLEGWEDDNQQGGDDDSGDDDSGDDDSGDDDSGDDGSGDDNTLSEGDVCTPTGTADPNAKAYKIFDGECLIQSCNTGYTLDEVNDKCVDVDADDNTTTLIIIGVAMAALIIIAAVIAGSGKMKVPKYYPPRYKYA